MNINMSKEIGLIEQKRIVDWAMLHLEDWEMICGVSKTKLTQEEFDRLSKILLDENFNQVFFVLFYRFAKQHNIPVFPKI